jgi:hypothetical protein
MQLPVDVRRPGEEGAEHESWQRIGQELPGEIRVVFDAGSREREAAESVHPDAAPGRDEGLVRPRPRQDLVAGDLDLLGQDPQLQVPGQRLVDQARQQRIIEKVFNRDLG